MSTSDDSLITPPFIMEGTRTESTFEEIPVIDIAAASSSDPVQRRALADLIRDACINVGFFYIENHGVPERTIGATIDAAKRFFALPEEEKTKLDIHKSANFKGYTALLGENTNPENDGDLHEGFDLGWEELRSTSSSDGIGSAKEEKRVDGVMAGENVWPKEIVIKGFREPLLEYYHAVLNLGRSLFPLFALALDLPEDYFTDKITNPGAIMRVLHYPPQPQRTGRDDKVIGIGAHTDYECFTILWQDDVQALQVQNADGKWIDAVPISGSFVVNIGDQLARWTNDIFKSTVHRAANLSGKDRYSIPLFFGTNYDVLLTPLPGCVTPGTAPKYEALTAGEYVKSRLEATYAHSNT